MSKHDMSNLSDDQKFQLLVAAALQNRVDVLTGILKDAIHLIDRRNSDGLTPLLEAVTAGNADAVRVLLHFGANPDVASKNGSNIATVLRGAKLELKQEEAVHAAFLAAVVQSLIFGDTLKLAAFLRSGIIRPQDSYGGKSLFDWTGQLDPELQCRVHKLFLTLNAGSAVSILPPGIIGEKEETPQRQLLLKIEEQESLIESLRSTVQDISEDNAFLKKLALKQGAKSVLDQLQELKRRVVEVSKQVQFTCNPRVVSTLCSSNSFKNLS